MTDIVPRGQADNSVLVQQVDRIRQEQGLSWIELNRRVGERLGWSPKTTNYINRIRHNEVSPTLRVVTAIAESLGVPASELLEEGV